MEPLELSSRDRGATLETLISSVKDLYFLGAQTEGPKPTQNFCKASLEICMTAIIIILVIIIGIYDGESETDIYIAGLSEVFSDDFLAIIVHKQKTKPDHCVLADFPFTLKAIKGISNIARITYTSQLYCIMVFL